MLLTLRRAGHSRFYPPAIDLCICAFLRYTFSASHPTSSQNKVRVYWLNVRGVKITEQRLKAGCCWLSLPGWQRAAFTHTLGLWSPGSILPPFSPGSALTCLTLPNCNLSGSALLEQEDRGGRRGPAEYFDTAQLNRDWTKTTTVAQSRTDATIRQVEKETGGWGGERGWNYVLGVVFIKKKKKKRIFINCPFHRRFVNALHKARCGVPRLCSNLAAIEDARWQTARGAQSDKGGARKEREGEYIAIWKSVKNFCGLYYVGE